MKRYHVEFKDNTGNREADAIASSVEGEVVSNTQRYNDVGNDLAIITVPDENVEYMESLLDEDDNVVNYRAYED